LISSLSARFRPDNREHEVTARHRADIEDPLIADIEVLGGQGRSV
jgi:hypothetical protein